MLSCQSLNVSGDKTLKGYTMLKYLRGILVIKRSRIKASLTSSRKGSPEVKIEMPYDRGLFEEGLKAKGQVVGKIRGNVHYSISSYADLDSILGKNWHLRGFNRAGDCCYPILETIRFYIRQRRPLVEYIPLSKTQDERNTQSGEEPRLCVSFCFCACRWFVWQLAVNV